METINNAIAKITDEAMGIDNPLAFFIEEELTKVCTTEIVAAQILMIDKTLEECIDEVTKVARGKQKDSMAMLSHEEVRKIAFDYFRIDDKAQAAAEEAESKAENKQANEIIDVMDLL